MKDCETGHSTSLVLTVESSTEKIGQCPGISEMFQLSTMTWYAFMFTSIVCMGFTWADRSHNLCAIGKPLPNVFCGRGPNRQDCPSGYECNIDPADRFAVCCYCGQTPRLEPQLPSCKTVKCGRGEKCVLKPVLCKTWPCPPPRPVCEPKAKTCKGVKCGRGEECVLEPVTCITSPCPPLPVCRPKRNPCQGVKCGRGEECVLEPVTCITSPCPPLPVCRSMSNPCQNVHCPKGQYCVLQPINCVRAPCPPAIAQCQHPCATVLCPVGQRCEVENVLCVRAPCPPLPRCV